MDLFGIKLGNNKSADSNQAPVKPVAQRASLSAELVDSLDLVPKYQGLLSGKGGEIQVADEWRAGMVVLKISDRRATILIESDYSKAETNNYITLQRRVEAQGYAIAAQFYATSGVIASLYDLQQSANKSGAAVVETKDALQTQANNWIGKAIDANATDIHIELRHEDTPSNCIIRHRVNSRMVVWQHFPAEQAKDVVSHIYTKMSMNEGRSHPVINIDAGGTRNCNVPFSYKGKSYSLRWASSAVVGGWDIVLRILKSGVAESVPSLEDLGYEPSQVRELSLASRKAKGMLIMSGVTGSGKSTTLRTLVTLANPSGNKKVYTVEDPVEYRIAVASQISVSRTGEGEGGDNPFIEYMRVLMRMDPDILMAGEIRDAESTSLVKHFTQSGHKVFTTVHAGSAIEIVDRLTSKEFGLPRQTLASKSMISALVNQALLPVCCPDCKLPLKDNLHLVDPVMVDNMVNKFDIPVDTVNLVNPEGCPTCKHTGVTKQTVVAEIIVPDTDMLINFREGMDQEAELAWRGKRTAKFNEPDMTGKTAFEHGLYKVSQGIVDPRVLEDAFEPFEMYEIHEIVERKRHVTIELGD